MRFAFCLFKFFYYGGLARDFLRIAEQCRKRGHEIDVYAMEWHGNTHEGFNVTVLPVAHWRNHIRNKLFIEKLRPIFQHKHYDLIVGFNKMPGLDVYYAADPCYVDKAMGGKRQIYRLGGRFKYYSYCEQEVFGSESETVSLLISQPQAELFERHYHTPKRRMLMMPPGISKDRMRPENADQIRRDFRQEFSLSDDEYMALMVGTAYKTKGLDRSIQALAMLPEELKQKTRLFVVGEDKREPFEKMAKKLNVLQNITFFSGRDDVPRFLLGADVLLQPSYRENTGTAILEAIISGLPVLATDVCGYAFHIEKAKAGKIVKSPFSLDEFARLLQKMLVSSEREQWSKNGVEYSKTEDLYSMPEKAADIIEMVAKRKKH